MISSTSSMMTVLLACVAGISLLAGGIGIMNIMIVSVTERTREIGLRMSIGATGRDIMTQFLIEAVIISVTGGILGIITGAIATWMIKLLAHWYRADRSRLSDTLLRSLHRDRHNLRILSRCKSIKS